jgi:hypothetical protein
MSQYNLIFQGTIVDGYRVEQVKKNLDYFFDGLGVFWIGKGIYHLVR